jgi:hypothetical protein
MAALPCVFLLAVLLDGQICGASFLLGTVGIVPQILWLFLPPRAAALAAFSVGLLLDGTHLSIPFGLSAFFCLAAVFSLQLLRHHLNWDLLSRLFFSVPLFTAAYYLVLSLAVPCQVALFSAALSCLLSCLLNCALWKFFSRKWVIR